MCFSELSFQAPVTDEHLMLSHDDADDDGGDRIENNVPRTQVQAVSQARPPNKNISRGSICLAPCELLEVHSDVTTSCRFSPDGNYLATSGRDATVRIWKLDRQALGAGFDGSQQKGGGKQLKCWSESGGRLANCGTCFCPSEVLSMSWTLPSANNDQMLLFGTANRSIKLWSVAGRVSEWARA